MSCASTRLTQSSLHQFASKKREHDHEKLLISHSLISLYNRITDFGGAKIVQDTFDQHMTKGMGTFIYMVTITDKIIQPD